MKLPSVPRLPRRAPGPDARDSAHYPCDACGADLRFAPGETRLVCAHCGHSQDIPGATHRGTHHLAERPLGPALAELRGVTEAAAPADGRPDHDTEAPGVPPVDGAADHRTLSCPNCAAEITLPRDSHASECPFCATPVVLDTGPERLFKPQGLVPFALTEAEARTQLAAWLGRLWFAPNGLADFARKGRAMTGVYAPFWTFDAASRTRYSGQRGEHYYETRTVRTDNGSRTERVRKTRWYPAHGTVDRQFDDVLVYASRALEPELMRGLHPWDLATMTPYRGDYLAGFSAEGYTVELPEGHAKARAEMLQVIRSDVKRDIGGDAQRIQHIDPAFSAETFKHVLLPVWSAAYRFRGKSYRVVINAQSGRVSGDRPWSAWKIALAAIACAVVAAGIFYVSR